MPGSVAAASASAVLPLFISVSFEHARQWGVEDNTYVCGDSQCRTLTTTSRKTWRLTKRLTPDQWDDLLAFWIARNGTLDPFYFYDGTETTPRWTWDATGVSTTGRYTVRFGNTRMVGTLSIPRSETEIELIEIA
mgnify:FL=1